MDRLLLIWIFIICFWYLGQSQSFELDIVKRKYVFKHKDNHFDQNLSFDLASDFVNGFCAVSNDEKWGFVDTFGVLVVPTIYDDVIDYSNGIAIVELFGKYGLIDDVGGMVIEPIYDDIETTEGDYFLVRDDDNFGIVDENGIEVVPPLFEEIDHYLNDTALVKIDDNWSYWADDGLLKTSKELIFFRPNIYAKCYDCKLEYINNLFDKSYFKLRDSTYYHIKVEMDSSKNVFVKKRFNQHTINSVVYVEFIIDDGGGIAENKVWRTQEDSISLKLMNFIVNNECSWIPAEVNGIPVTSIYWIAFQIIINKIE